MKRLNKVLQSIITTVATVAMALVLVPNAAFAAGSHTISITAKDDSSHSYAAYQVFAGDYDAKTGKLSNVKWGNGVNGDTLLTALKADANANKDDFASCKSAADVANVLAGYENDSAKLDAFASIVGDNLGTTSTTATKGEGKAYSISGLADGYYFVKDTAAVTGTGASTKYILQVVGDVSVNAKSDVPTVQKKVKDTNDSTGTTSDWQDSADADINDEVQYQITGTLPDNYDAYTKYSYKFTDTMSKGLTYTASTDAKKSFKVMLYKDSTDTIGTDITRHFAESITDYAGTDTDYTGGKVITWTENDANGLKGIAGVTKDSKIVVTYTAKLNGDAKIGAAGNPNKVDLTFSNNPNKGGEGETGKTPEDKNIVFTYKTVVNKVDQDKQPLAGAAFKLEKKVKKADGTTEYKLVNELTAGTETSFEFSGLDDGDYRLTETTTPAGYNTISPIEFTISADHDTDSADPKLNSLNGNVTTGTITFAADKDAGSLTTDVVNKQGSTLPSTGGMGTTILYVAGAAIVVAAGVGLAIRRNKRQNA